MLAQAEQRPPTQIAYFGGDDAPQPRGIVFRRLNGRNWGRKRPPTQICDWTNADLIWLAREPIAAISKFVLMQLQPVIKKSA
jgi:hypothetical protein